jgi:hypothetical protein
VIGDPDLLLDTARLSVWMRTLPPPWLVRRRASSTPRLAGSLLLAYVSRSTYHAALRKSTLPPGTPLDPIAALNAALAGRRRER